MKQTIIKILGTVITLALLGGMIYLRVRISYENFDPQSSNFSFFWLAGRMVIDGQNPYDETQYLAGHDANGIEWKPNKIFPYPLPLAILCVPLGLFSLKVAYTIWQVVTLLIIAITVFTMLDHWKSSAHQRLLVPIFAFLFFFGPEYLTLHVGSIGALALLSIWGAILLYQKGESFWAGVLLSLTVLKPPQGATILVLIGIWFIIARRDWKAIYGLAIGGIVLLLIGMIQDPMWLLKFRGASAAVMDRTQGVHSNVWAFAYLACKGTSPCWTLLGAALSLSLLGLAGFFLWKNQAKWSAWEAMNLIIPVGFLSTIYLWAYDQIPYIIPIVWIVGTLVQKSRSYIYAFLFLIMLDLFSLYALAEQASTRKDLWSLGTTLIVMTGLVLAARMKQKPLPTKAATEPD